MYIGHVERTKKPITEESNDQGHIDESLPQIIRYVAASADHKFVLEQTLKADETITFSIFQAVPEGGAAPAPGGEEEEQNPAKKEEQPEAKKEDGIKYPHKFIPDVTKEPKLKFFRVPKLGCYLAVSLKYNSCLYESSLDKAIEAFHETKDRKEKQEREMQDYEDATQKEKRDKEAAGEEYHEPHKEWPKVVEPPYLTKERDYVLCVDTLGQDRIFTEEERKFVIDIAQHIVNCWQECENVALTKDKQLRLAIKLRDEEFKNEEFGRINDEIEKAGEDALSDETLYAFLTIY